jgi:hypothetical protein
LRRTAFHRSALTLTNRLLKTLLPRARHAYLRVVPQPAAVAHDRATVTEQAASDLIRDRILDDEPVLIARLGAVETGCLLSYLAIHEGGSTLRKSLRYIRGSATAFWWDESTVATMTQNAGFFPADPLLLDRFCARMLGDLPCIDILGSWLPEEERLASELRNAVKVRLRDLEPYYHRDPWTEALAGQVVLVVHPFAESIQRQYGRRERLFDDRRVLPEFELKTLKAVQSIANSDTGFETWFDAYDSMRDQIAHTDFDVALLGCGAYGLPLAADVKRLGKKAVHLGGASQILFGVKGRRWDEHELISRLYNEHWVRPLPSETPDNYLSVEGGCYW